MNKILKSIALVLTLVVFNFSYAQKTINKVSDEICQELETIDKNLSQEEIEKQVEQITLQKFLIHAMDLMEENNIDIDDSDIEGAFEELGLEIAKNLMNECDAFVALIVNENTSELKSNKKTKAILSKMSDEVCDDLSKMKKNLSSDEKMKELEKSILATFFANYEEVMDAFEIKDLDEKGVFEKIGVELGIQLANDCDTYLDIFMEEE